MRHAARGGAEAAAADQRKAADLGMQGMHRMGEVRHTGRQRAEAAESSRFKDAGNTREGDGRVWERVDLQTVPS